MSNSSIEKEETGTDTPALVEQLEWALRALTTVREDGDDAYSPAVLYDLIGMTTALHQRATGIREALVRNYVTAGGSIGSLAQALGTRRSTAQHQRERILAAANRRSPLELWARAEYGDPDQAANVPPGMEPWSVPWPGYLPVNVTDPRLRSLEVLAEEGAEWGAEQYLTPYGIPGDELIERRAAAWIEYEHDHRRWPLHPWGRRGSTGRRMKRWGENKMADAILVAGKGSDRKVLMIQRSDNGKVALPGGHVDGGESPIAAAMRELEEETGVIVPANARRIPLEKRIVDDHRATDHCWPVTAPLLILIDEPIQAFAADDAIDTRWVPFGTMEALADYTGPDLFLGHRPILEAAHNYITIEEG